MGMVAGTMTRCPRDRMSRLLLLVLLLLPLALRLSEAFTPTLLTRSTPSLPVTTKCHSTLPSKQDYHQPPYISELSSASLMSSASLSTARPDPIQTLSLTSTAPAVLLHSGPGTGKSRVLASRLASLLLPCVLENKRESVVVLSFTTKAADGIKNAALNMIKDHVCYTINPVLPEEVASKNVWSGSIHKFSLMLLRKYDCKNYIVSDNATSLRILRSLIEGVGNGRRESNYDKALDEIFKRYDAGGKRFFVGNDFVNGLHNLITKLDDATINPTDNGSESLMLAKALLPLYKLEHSRQKLIPLSSLVSSCVKMLQDNDNILESVRKKLKHIIVDEYQDISPIQHTLLKLIVNGPPPSSSSIYSSTPHSNLKHTPTLYAAGDADQTIYNFRGAMGSASVGGFRRDYSQGVVVDFINQYRIPRRVWEVAKLFRDRDETMVWKGTREGDVKVEGRWDEKEEDREIVRSIKKKYVKRFEDAFSAEKKEGRGMKKDTFREHFRDGTRVAVMVRNEKRIHGIAKSLSEAGIPFIAEGRNVASSQGGVSRKQQIQVVPDILKSEYSKQALQLLGGVEEGDHISCGRFQNILLMLGRYQSDINKLINKDDSRSLFENANDVDEGDSEGVRFVRKWHKLITGDDYVGAKTADERKDILMRCLCETSLLKKTDCEERSKRYVDLETLCSMIGAKKSVGRFIVEEALGEDIVLADAAVNAGPGINMPPVNLITMHRAKGTEFDDVYLPSWNEGVFPYSDADVAEERRLAFVALSRTRRSVMISYLARHGGGTFARPSRFLHEIKASDPSIVTRSSYKSMNADVSAHWESMRKDRMKEGVRGGALWMRSVPEAPEVTTTVEGLERKVAAKIELKEDAVDAVEMQPKVKVASAVASAAVTASSEPASVAPIRSRKDIQKLLRDVRAKKMSSAEGKKTFRSILGSQLGIKRGSYKKKRLSACTAIELGVFLLTKVKN